MVNNILQPILDHLDFTKTRLTGELDTQVINAEEALMNARTTRAIFQLDPSLRTIKALGDLDRNFPITSFNSTFNKMTDVLALMSGEEESVSNLFDNTDEGVPKELLFQDISKVLATATSAGATPTQVDMAKNTLNNIMESVEVFGGKATPENMKEFMRFARDPAFAKSVEVLGYDKGGLQKAKDVYDKRYADVVYPKIATRFLSEGGGLDSYRTPSGGKLALPAPSAYLEPVVKNGVVSFQLKPEFSSAAPRRNDAFVERSSQELGIPLQVLREKRDSINRQLSSHINDLVKVAAHLQGRTDYEKVFEEELGATLRVEEQEAEKPVAEPEPKLTLKDIPQEDIYRSGDFIKPTEAEFKKLAQQMTKAGLSREQISSMAGGLFGDNAKGEIRDSILAYVPEE
jgi:hypothetical protein